MTEQKEKIKQQKLQAQAAYDLAFRQGVHVPESRCLIAVLSPYEGSCVRDPIVYGAVLSITRVEGYACYFNDERLIQAVRLSDGNGSVLFHSVRREDIGFLFSEPQVP